MSTISVQEIESDPTGFLRRVEAGESFLVVGKSRPLAEVKPISSPDESLRPYGLAAGRFATPDDFDQPLPAEVIRDFEGR
jgi:antitoxin (DNA-binding transcriptional repressor) of toxin-antitoxin stability system